MKNPWLNAKARILHRHIGHGRGFVSAGLMARDKFSFLKVLIESIGSAIAPNGARSATVKKIGGKSIVWNQLSNGDWFDPRTSSGITWTNNGDGSLSYSGTLSSIYSSCYMDDKTNKYNLIVGHTYYFKNCNVQNVTPSGTGLRKLTSVTETATCFAVVTGSAGETISGTITPQIFDLTQMFGAGNEPTIAEFESMFPDGYYPYNAGEIKDGAVNAINVVGANVLDMSRFESSEKNGIAYTYLGNNAVKVKGTATSSSDSYVLRFTETEKKNFKTGVKYNFSSSQHVNLVAVVYRKATGANAWVSTAFTLNDGDYVVYFYLNVSEGTTVDETVNCMISESSDTSFVPYHEPKTIPVGVARNLVDYEDQIDERSSDIQGIRVDISDLNDGETFTISVDLFCAESTSQMYACCELADGTITHRGTRVMAGESGKSILTFVKNGETRVGVTYGSGLGICSATNFQMEHGSTATPYVPHLNGYGRSAGTVYNEVDFDRKKFIQRVGVVDLGTLDWNRYGDSFWYTMDKDLFDSIKTGGSAKFLSKYYISGYVAKSTQNVRIYTNNTEPPNGLMYFELETPIETDISEIINSFDVTNGDTIEFVNAINQAIPNAIEFAVDPNEYEEPTPMLMTMSDEINDDDHVIDNGGEET